MGSTFDAPFTVPLGFGAPLCLFSIAFEDVFGGAFGIAPGGLRPTDFLFDPRLEAIQSLHRRLDSLLGGRDHCLPLKFFLPSLEQMLHIFFALVDFCLGDSLISDAFFASFFGDCFFVGDFGFGVIPLALSIQSLHLRVASGNKY